MMPQDRTGRVLLAVTGFDAEPWVDELEKGREAMVSTDRLDDPSIRYAVVWKQPEGCLSDLPNLKAIFSLGAGVDHLLADRSLPDVPIVRVVSPNLTQYMVDYVVWRVLDHLRRGRAYREAQAERAWSGYSQPLASDVRIGIMGIGELGGASAKALNALGFQLAGWSRTPRPFIGTGYHGRAQLDEFLAATDILVVLLPLTAETQGIVDYELLSKLRRHGALGGPVLINAGRGKLQKEADILSALDDGLLLEASLDVFETEPLPRDSALWTHPRVFITPHAAAPSSPEALVPDMLRQMDAHDRGEPLKNLVDRKAGY